MRLAEPIATSFDNTEVRALVVRLGIGPRLEFPPDASANTIDYFVKDHPTHWLFFSRYRGFPNPKDNGYAVVGFFKKAFSEAEATRFVANTMAGRKSVPLKFTFLPTVPEPQS